jgi:hypothetical protein
MPRGGHNKTHGMAGSRTYASWNMMRNRCSNPNYAEAQYYADNGITVCERWALFENFLADMGVRPDGKSLDRIDNRRGYSPDNCRWATPTEQALNRSDTRKQVAKGLPRNIYLTRRNGFEVAVRRDGKLYYLGGFETVEEAIAVRDRFLEEWKARCK